MNGKACISRFSVGYQLQEEQGEEPFEDIVRDYKDNIAEVYFPWANMPSGRSPMLNREGYVNWEGQHKLEKALAVLKKSGIKLNLLFNSNCYGKLALSQHIQNLTVSVIDRIKHVAGGIDTVTTSSLAVAKTVKTYAPDVDVRASVNMRIGTTRAMDYVAGFFDSYYVQREYNRDIEYLETLKAWADKNGKKLFLLANSGCMNFCSAQTFHDNAVAHEQDIAETKNIEGLSAHVCWNYYSSKKNRVNILKGSWIRPEDAHHYSKSFGMLKLATRMHANPRLVIEAYSRGRYRGNLLDLLEPGFSPIFAPCVLRNELFPEEWFDVTSKCRQQCEECGYCEKVLEKISAEY